MLIQNNDIRFLIATDVHLGHKEKHPVLKDDSFQAFEEVLEQAKRHEVDFLLLGGDLFDEVNPSKQCFFRCLNLLKQHVFGNREVSIQVSLNGQPYPANFTNQMINISLPVFTIHGNHDYPSNQFGKISACDLLQASNYVNYFGKHLSLHHILIRPLIITKKGSNTKIALYGLGYIKDPILNDLFEEQEASFEKPVGDLKDYFTIFVMHQNRYKKNFKPGVPISHAFSPKNIPEWINLTLWGHQHEAIYKIQSEYDRQIFQPGSTVITSFIQAESFKKQCALISVRNNTFQLQSILLTQSFRPMFCLSFQLKMLHQEMGEQFNLYNFLDSTIANVLKCSMVDHPERKPIIRIKMEYTGLSEIVRMQQIQSKYSNYVANCQKIVMYWKRKEEKVNRITDEELFSNIRNKKMITASSWSMNQELEILIKQKVDNSSFTYFPKELFLQVTGLIAKDEGQVGHIIKKRMVQLQIKKRKNMEENMAGMNNHKEKQLKKALKYNYEKKELLCKNKLPKDNHNSQQQFLSQEQNITNSHKFSTHCRIMQEKAGHKPASKQKAEVQIPQKVVVVSAHSNPSRISIIKKQADLDDDMHRSQSEDCCERALKQPMDEQGIKSRFQQARIKIQQVQANRLKKNDKVDGKIGNKPQKNVRFNNDFY